LLEQYFFDSDSTHAPKDSLQDFFRIVVDGWLDHVLIASTYSAFRVAILRHFFTSTQVLGVSSLPKGPESHKRRPHVDALYPEFHESLDKSSLQTR